VATLDDLKKAVTEVLDALVPTIASAKRRAWNPEVDGVLPLLRRAVLVRQYECLQAILDLEKGGRGYAGVTLLRPAVEELIWCKYFSHIDHSVGSLLARVMSALEMQDSLKAQDDYLGRSATKDLGLMGYLDQSGQIEAQARGHLRAIGRQLKWDRRTIEAGMLPSMAYLAKRTELKQEYNYLYHATSRFVHFSVAELLRRAWGTRESVSITSENFRHYWTAFAVYWGFWLLSRTYLLMEKELTADGVDDPDIDGDAIIKAFERIAEFGHVPIVTEAELKPGFENAV